MASPLAFFPIVSVENLPVHPTQPQFSLGMEEWTDSYLELLEQSSSAVSTRLNAHTSASINSSPPKSRPGPSSQLVPFQPRPQFLHLPLTASTHASPLPWMPTTCKEDSPSKLSKEELDTLTKACVPKNTENSTKWALENFKSWMSNR